MTPKQFTKKEIDVAMQEAKAKVEQEFTIETLRILNPRLAANVKKIPDSYEEYDQNVEHDLNTLIERLLDAKKNGATNFRFNCYSDESEVTFYLVHYGVETDEVWTTRLQFIQKRKSNDAMNKAAQEMQAHNHDVEQYLKLQKKFK